MAETRRERNQGSRTSVSCGVEEGWEDDSKQLTEVPVESTLGESARNGSVVLLEHQVETTEGLEELLLVVLDFLRDDTEPCGRWSRRK